MKLHSFNKYVSDVISLKRELPDTRHHTCRQINYDTPQSLPTTSVILIFSNEALSAVLRTVWSLILRTPKEMLNEIILVDDGSTHEGQFNFVFHIQMTLMISKTLFIQHAANINWEDFLLKVSRLKGNYDVF